MTWIRVDEPADNEAVAKAVDAATSNYPAEYSPTRRGERNLPSTVADDNIILAHSLIPKALEHMIGGFGALMSPDLPLGRRDHELIAAVTSRLNRCFY